MKEYTIYSEEIWQRMLEKYPKVKALATELGIQNDPEKAKEIRRKCEYNFGELTELERELAIKLASIEFVECDFLRMVVRTGTEHHKNGAGDYAIASFHLVLQDFEESFKDWYREVKRRNIPSDASFATLYGVFLDVIKLKMDYKVPYTKLFVHRLLETSSMPKEDALEVKQYFLTENPEMLPELEEYLI